MARILTLVFFLPPARLFAVLLLLLGPSGAALAQRVALVVGNGGYQTLRGLENPARDGGAIADSLMGLGFEVIPVVDGGLGEMQDGISRFRQAARGAEVALVYYAGHGVQLGGESFLLPVDVNPDAGPDLAAQAISASQIREALLTADARTGILILDACRNDPFATESWVGRGITLGLGDGGPDEPSPNEPSPGQEGADEVGRDVNPARQTVAEGLARMGGGAGLLIAYATDPGNVAADGRGDHSPFTQALLRHIDTPGLDARLMFGRVRQTVVLDTNGAQTPWVEESLLGEFAFVDAPPEEGGAAESSEAGFWHAIADSTNPADFEVYLQNYPEGIFAALARNRLASFGTAIRADEISLNTLFENDLANTLAIQRSLFVLGYLPASAMTGEQDSPTRRAMAAYLRLSGISAASEAPLGIDVITGLHRRAAEALVYLGGAIGTDLNVDLETLRAVLEAERVALQTWGQMRDRVVELGGTSEHPALQRAQTQIAAIRDARLRLEDRLDGLRETYQGLLETAGAFYADLLSGGENRALAQYAVGGTRIERFARSFVDQATGGLGDRGLDSIAWMTDVLNDGAPD